MAQNSTHEEKDERSFDKKVIELLELNIYWKIAKLFYKIWHLIFRHQKKLTKPSLYSVFWAVTASVSVVLIAFTFKLTELLWAEVFNFYMIFFVPMGFLWLSMIFLCIELEERNHIDHPVKGFFSPWQTRLFSIKYPFMWFLPIAIIILGLRSLTVHGLTITSGSLILSRLKGYRLILIEGAIMFFLSGHAAYAAIVNLVFQFKIVHYLPVKPKFMETSNKMVYCLLNYTYSQSLLLFGGYALLFLAVKSTGFNHMNIFNIYLEVLVILPLLSLVWGIIQTHTLQVKIKFNQLSIIEKKIFQSEFKKSNINELAKLIEIKKYIEKMPEWPVSLQSVITLSITSAAVIIQILYTLGKITILQHSLPFP